MPLPSEERFDIVTPDGMPTGQTRPRSEVHRDGDWHRAFHLWIGWRGADGAPRLLLQRRAPDKDTWPDRLDVAVGGHYSAGETLDDVFREVEEELGFRPDRRMCIPAGIRRAERLDANWTDREIQDVFVLALPDGPPDLAPCPDEISALVQVSLVDFVSLLSGREDEISVGEAPVLSGRRLGPWKPALIILDNLVDGADEYWLAATDLVVRALNGERSLELRLS